MWSRAGEVSRRRRYQDVAGRAVVEAELALRVGVAGDLGAGRIGRVDYDVRAREITGDADAQGEFRIHDCPTGELIVGAQLGDAQGSTRATVRAGDEVLGLAYLEIR